MTDVIGFSNEGRTTLNGGITAGATSITVAAGSPTLPASGKAFDLRIENEYVTVPAASNTGGPTYSPVTRGAYGSTAASHADTTPVIEVVTAVELGDFHQEGQALSATTGAFTGEVSAPHFKATGKTGATTNPLYLAGMTASGHPTTGPHLIGELVGGEDGSLWLCTTAGTPGTWTQIGPASSDSDSLATLTDVVISGIANGDLLTYNSGAGKWENAPAGSDTDPDATTTTVGVVEVDHAPSGAHPVALTTDGLVMPPGLLGTTGSKATAGNDSRLSDARTPTAHETTHLPNGSDAIDWAGTIHQKGTHALRPAAGATNTGVLYFETDTGNLFRSDGATWLQIAISTGGGGGSTTLAGDTDVSISSAIENDLLTYDAATAAWKNKPDGQSRVGVFNRSAYAQAMLALAPKVYYRFGDPVGRGVFRDYGSLGYDGTYVNAPTLGIDGGSGDGDLAATMPGGLGAQNNVVPAGLPLASTARTSIVWFRWPSAFGANLPVLMSYGTGDDGHGSYPGGFTTAQSWDMELNSDPTKVGLATNANDIIWTDATMNTADNLWHMFVVTFDGTNAIAYVDNKSLGSQTFPGAINTQNFTNRRITFGDRDGNFPGLAGAGHNYSGDVDEAAILDYKLTAAQVASLWNAAHQSVGSAAQAHPFSYRESVLFDLPLAYWKFEETALGTVADETGNANTLTSSNSAVPNVAGPLFGSSAFHFTGGGFGFGGQLSGAGAKMPLGTDRGLTFAGWFRLDSSNFATTDLMSYGGGTLIVMRVKGGSSSLGLKVGGTEQVISIGADLRDDTWHHLAVGTDWKGVVAWLDGVRKGSIAFVGTPPTSAGTITFGIGADNFQGNVQGGYYDEDAVFNYLLSDGQVAAHYASRTKGIFGNPMQAPGDMIQGDVNGRPQRTPIGTGTYIWTSNGTTGEWDTPASSQVYFGGFTFIGRAEFLAGAGISITRSLGTLTVAATDGGLLSGDSDVAITSIAKGDILIYDSTGAAWKNYAAGTSGFVLTSNGLGAAPTWQAAVGGGSSTLAGDTDVSIASVANGDLLVYDSGAAKWQNYAAGSAGSVLTGNGAGAKPTWQAASGGATPLYTTPLALSNWTWQNQGGASAADDTNALHIQTTATGAAHSLRILKRTLPATPWTIQAMVVVRSTSDGNVAGICVTDGTKVTTLAWQGGSSPGGKMDVFQWSDVTTFSSSLSGQTEYATGPLSFDSLIRWYKITDDGTTRKYFFSFDGVGWILVGSEVHAGFLTPTAAGFFASCVSSTTPVLIWLNSWSGA